MSTFKAFEKQALSEQQMQKINGGHEPGIYLDCVNANGSTTTLYVRYPYGNQQIADSVDDFNDNSGLSPIVGCEAPY